MPASQIQRAGALQSSLLAAADGAVTLAGSTAGVSAIAGVIAGMITGSGRNSGGRGTSSEKLLLWAMVGGDAVRGSGPYQASSTGTWNSTTPQLRDQRHDAATADLL
ncbi:MAG: hypothetical protein A2V70_19555 [Planctomycetes bacterium RBG_13_63_9]|nr:MAG: hypothetical protein A2V70_19555 [Planctomycetes bacterium RBG_13_63_9]